MAELHIIVLFFDLASIAIFHILHLQLLVPLLGNDRNHEAWPQVVSADVLRHVHNLKSSVYVVSGQVRGKTLLPLPVGAEKVETTEESEDTYILTIFGFFNMALVNRETVNHINRILGYPSTRW